MKKVLAFALVGLLAASSVFAGITLGGEFKAGYNIPLNFNDFGETYIKAYNDAEAKLTIVAKDDDGIWTVTLKDSLKTNSGNAIKATGTVNIDKLAAKLGSDWGNWKLSLTAGENNNPSISSAYNSDVGGGYSKIKMNAPHSMVFAVKDGGWVDVQVGIDPTFTKGSKDISAMVSAKIAPIDGLAISAGYVFNGSESFYRILDPANAEVHTKVDTLYFAHAIAAEFNLNLAKMIGLDFDLAISGGDSFLIGAQSTKTSVLPTAKDMGNAFGVGIYAGIDLISGHAEFLMGTAIPDGGKAESLFGFNAGIKSTCGVDGLTVNANLKSIDVTEFADNYEVSGGVSYGLSGTGITLGCDLKFDKKVLTFTPTMTIKF